MNTRPKNPANARNLNACVIGSSGSGKTRFWLTPQLLQAHSSYVVVDPKGGTLSQCGHFLQRKKGYKIKVFNSIDFSKSMHYNPMSYIKTESDVLKFVNALIANTKGDGKEGDEFWTKAETLLYCALVAYIVFEGPEEERNMNTLVEMINSMEVREDDENFKNAVDYMFDGLAKRNPQHFAVRQYAKYKLASGKTAKSILISCGARLAPFDMPTLQNLYDLLCQQTEPEAKRLATALEIYVSGSLNIFNHKTNVDYRNARVVCFDLKRLGAGLRTIAMHIINDLMNSQVSHNFARGIATWCYYDEFHVLLQDELTSSYFVTIWKMLRKKGCVPSALTQNVKDLLASRQIENIFENSDFMVLLSQAQGDRQILARQLGISPHQLSYVTHSNPGEGLLFFGNVTIPFVDRFPKNTKLYSIMTTRPEEKEAQNG